MDKTLKELQKTFGIDRIKINEPMTKHATFKIGGPAQFYLEISELKDLVKAAKVARELKIPLFILGTGSNILISDWGITGLVVKNNCRKFFTKNIAGRVKNQKISQDAIFIYAQSGAITNQLVRFTIEEGLEGLEYHLGLPGTVGGAIFGNANFPQEKANIGDSLYRAGILTKEGETREVDKFYFDFSYDQSILQKTGEILLWVIFKLFPAKKEILWERAMRALNHRNTTQPKGASAGCIFQNISLSQAMSIPTPNNITSAGYLIDKAGLKGKRVGDAIISDVHANYILNLGRATAEDVFKLINLAREEVFKKFGVRLALEIRTIEFDKRN